MLARSGLNATAADIRFDAAVSGSGSVALRPAQPSDAIALGGSPAPAAARLEISSVELGRLFSGGSLASLTIGRTDSSGSTVIEALAMSGSIPLDVLGGNVAVSGTVSGGAGALGLISNVGDIDLAADLSFGGALSLDSAAGVTQSGGSLTLNGLAIRSAGAASVLDPANDIGALAADISGAGQALTVASSGAMAVSVVDGLSGVTTNGGDATLRAGGIAIDQTINVGGSLLTLDSSAGATQAAAVSAGLLEVLGAGAFALDLSTNSVGTLAADIAGSLTYADSDGLTIGTAGATTGAGASAALDLRAGQGGTGDLAVGAVTLEAASVTLTAGAGGGGAGGPSVSIAGGATLTDGAGAAPSTFEIIQDGSIGDADIPAASLFDGGSLAGVSYRFHSRDGDVSVATASKVAGASLDLRAGGDVTISADLALDALSLEAEGNVGTQRIATSGNQSILFGQSGGATATVGDLASSAGTVTILGGAGDDAITISSAGSPGSGAIAINGLGGDDSLTLDATAGSPLPTGGIGFDGGAGSNDAELIGGGFTSAALSITGADSANAVLDGRSIGLLGTGSLRMTSAVDDLAFTLTGGADTAALADAAGAGLNQLSGAGLMDVVFPTPAVALTLDTAGGGDVVTVSALDSAFGADVSIDLGTGADSAELAAITGGGTWSVGGGAGLDGLTGPSANLTWSISGMGAGSVSGGASFGFDGMESLTGAGGEDTFTFGASGSLAGAIDGGAGSDALDLSAVTDPATIDLEAGSATRTGGIAGFESFVANGADATLIGASNVNAWTVTGSGVGDVDGVAFSGFTDLTGGSGADTFAFDDGAAVLGAVDGGGGGADELDLSAFTGAIAVDVASGTATGTGGIANFESFRGPGGASASFAGPGGVAAWTIDGVDSGDVAGTDFSGFGTLIGGGDADTFTFTAGSLAGDVLGGLGSDEIVGPGGAPIAWLIDAADGGTFDRIGGAFSSVESLAGGGADDTFGFAAGGSLSGSLAGGAGTDTLDYSGFGAAVDVDLSSGDATAIAGGFAGLETLIGTGSAADTLRGADDVNTWTLSGAGAGDVDGFAFSSIANLFGGSAGDAFDLTAGSITGDIDGGGGTDTLIAANASNIWNITGLDTGTVGGVGGTFSSVENLTGGSMDDAFVIDAGAGVTGDIDGRGGTDTVDFSAFASPLMVDLGGGTGTGFGSIASVESLIGGAASDVLLGGAGGNTWMITGADAGSVDGTAFDSFEQLVAGDGGDGFIFADGASIAGSITGGSGTDALDFSAYSTSIAANLETGTATPVASFSAIETLIGGAAADTLTGPAGGANWSITAADGGSVAGVDFQSFENLTGLGGSDTFTLNGGSVSGAIDGGPGGDTLAADDTTNTWVIDAAGAGTLNAAPFTGIENLVGGASDDAFGIDPLGLLAGTIDAGLGDDELSYAGFGSAVSVNLGTGGATATGGVTGFDSFIGASDPADIITGPDSGATWTFTGADSGAIGGIDFSGFANAMGGMVGDVFILDGGSLSGTLDGGGGDDTLRGPNTGGGFSITAADAGTIAAIAGGFSSIESLEGRGGVDTFAFAGGTLSGNIDGGGGTDTVVGPDADIAWAISGIDGGSLDGLAGTFAGIENLTGGTGIDTFSINAGSLSGTIDGGGGDDAINYAGFAGAVSIDLEMDTATAIGGFTSIESFTGSSGVDTFAGPNANLTWTISGAGMGTVDGVDFVGFEDLVGGAGNDDFDFADGVNAAGMVTGGLGNDTADFSAWTAALTVDAANFAGFEAIVGGMSGADTLAGDDILNTWLIDGFNAGTLNTTLDFSSFENLTGGSGSDGFTRDVAGSLTGAIDGGGGDDTLAALGGPNTWTITALNAGSVTGLGGFAGVENLVGGAMADVFAIDAGGVAGTIDGAAGANELRYTAFAGPVAVDLGAGNATATGGFSNIAVFEGSGADDSLTGPAGDQTWNITANNAGDVGGFDFASFENLMGAGGDDSFVFAGNFNVSGSVTGGAGIDTLDYGLRTASLILDLTATGAGIERFILGAGANDEILATGAADAFVISGAGMGTVNGADFENVESLRGRGGADTFTFAGGTLAGGIVGGGGSDTITGPDAVTNWDITGAGAGSLDPLTGAFTGIENLTGGTGDDTFTFAANVGVTGVIDGGVGFDTLDYSAWTNDLTIDLATLASGIESVTAGSGNDTLIGENADQTWTITAGADTVGAVTFDDFENLTGGSADDTFDFDGGTIAGDVVGGGGTDTIIADDVVNTWSLTGAGTGTVTGVGGTFAGVENLTGGSIADTLAVDGAGSLAGTFDGAGGDDTLSFAPRGSAVLVDLAAGDATDITSVMNVEAFIGGSGGGDTFASGNGVNNWSIDTPTSGDVDGIDFDAFENLVGGAGDDAFAFADGVNAPGTLTGGGGTDTLDYSAWTSALTINAADLTGFDAIIGGAAVSDTLVGADTANAWLINGAEAGTLNAGLDFSAFENLTGGSDIDTFTFAGGTLAGDIAGGGGSDEIVGPDALTNWNISAADAGTLDPLSGGFTSVENLTGGTGDDNFTFATNVTVSGAISGGAGGGSDTADYSAWTNQLVVDLGAGVDGFETVIAGSNAGDTVIGEDAVNAWTITGAGEGDIGALSFQNFENLAGGSQADTFTFGPAGSIAGAVDGGAGDDVIVGSDAGWVFGIDNPGSGSANGTPFSDIENLTGGAGVDVFEIATGGSLSGAIDGAGADDTLSYAGFGGPVTVNLETGAATNVTGGAISIEVFAGSASADEIIAPNSINIWSITAPDAGSVAGVDFTGFENLTGGTAADTFAFNDGIAASGLIDGGAGTDAADYGAWTTPITITLGADLANVENIDGGAAMDTLRGANAPTAWTINGANAGDVAGIAFTSFESLIGGNTADDFVLAAAGSLSGSIDGGGGPNALTGPDAPRSWIITGANAGDVGGVSGGFTNIQSLLGGSTADVFTFTTGSLTGAIDGGGGADTLIAADTANTWTINAADTGTVTNLPAGFSDVENLTGGSASDVFAMQPGAAVSGTLDGAGGANALDYTAAGGPVSIDLQTSSATGVASFTNMTSFTGSAASDTFTAANTNNTWSISASNAGSIGAIAFDSFENLIGGSADDDFVFADGFNATGSLDGGPGPGTDTLNYAAWTSPLTIDLESFATGFEQVTGGSAADTLVGPDAVNAWSISAPDAGSVGLVSFSSFENLTGNSQADTFTFSAAGSLSGGVDGGGALDELRGPDAVTTWTVSGGDTGSLDPLGGVFTSVESLTGGAQADTFNIPGAGMLTGALDGGLGFDIVAYTGPGPVSVNLQTAGATGLASFADIDRFEGSAAGDTLIGPDTVSAWNITAADAGAVAAVEFAFFENLTGGTADDTFTFQDGADMSGTITAGGGDDTLDYGLWTSNLTIELARRVGFDTLIGGVATDTLIGEDAVNNWQITGANAGTLAGLDWSGIESITGGALADTFTFTAPGAELSGLLDGGSGDDTAIGPDVATAFTLAGGNEGTLGATDFTGIESLTGGAADDTFTFNAAGSLAVLLDGGGGTDTLSFAPRSTAVMVDLQSLNATDINAFASIEDVVGSSVLDTIRGPDAINVWAIDMNNGGSVAGVAFEGFENLIGGTLADTFTIDDGVLLAGAIDGGGGTDELDLGGWTSAVTIDLGLAAATPAASISSIESFTGGAASDTFIGPGGPNTWTIGASNTGDVDGVDFTSFESLHGGTDADVFVFTGAGALGGSIDGRGGDDVIEGTAAGDTWTITTLDAGSVGFISGGFASIENIRTRAGDDAVTIDPSAGLTGALDLGTGDDTLSYNAWTADITIDLGAGTATAIGSLAGAENLIAGAGSDTLIAADTASTFTLSGAGAGTLNASSFTGFEHLAGGAAADVFDFTAGSISGSIDGRGGDDEIIGPSADTIWSIASPNAGSFEATPFLSIENITAGAGQDAFTFADGATLAGTLDAGGGADTVDFAAYLTPITVNLEAQTATPLGGLVSAETIRGGSAADTLVATDTNNVWTISSPGAGMLNAISFAGFEDLVGGSAADTFSFADGVTAAGSFDGAAGTDTADFSAWTSAVTLDLAGSTIAGSPFSSIEHFDAGTASNILTGPNAPTVWTITGLDSGSAGGIDFTNFDNIVAGSSDDTFMFGPAGMLSGALDGAGGNNAIQGPDAATTYTLTGEDAGFAPFIAAGFTNISNLVGGAAADVFLFQSAGRVTGGVDGGLGADTLDQGALTSPITIDLPAGTATRAGTIAGLETFVGGAGVNTFIGPAAGASWTINAVDAGSAGSLAFENFANLVGGGGADVFTFAGAGTLTGVLDGAGGTDELRGPDADVTYTIDAAGAGSATFLTGGFAAIEAITAGSGDDVFAISGGGSVAGLLDGGAGDNRIDYTGFAGPVTVNLPAGSATAIGGFAGVDEFTGSANADTFIGTNADTAWTITGPNAGTAGPIAFSGFENLVSGSGDDSLTIDGGFIFGSFSAGAGTDTLEGGDFGNTWTLTGAGAGGVTGVGGGFTGVENLTGGDGADVFNLAGGSIAGALNGGAGSDALISGSFASTWNITGPGTGSVTGIPGGFTSIETIAGGNGADTFIFADGINLTGVIDGGLGADIIDLSAWTTAVTLDLALAQRIETIIGGSTSLDTLRGTNSDTTFTLTAPNAGVAAFGSTALDFSGFENITAGAGNDVFVLSGSGALNGAIDGSAGTNALTAADTVNAWNLSAPSAGTLTGLGGGFSNITLFTGGSQQDTFTFADGVAPAAPIDGGGRLRHRYLRRLDFPAEHHHR